MAGDANWANLTAANRLLTEVTRHHHHACDCHLCEARSDTDVQDGESARRVRFEPADGA